MTDPTSLAAHYTRGGLLEAIGAGLATLGRTPQTVSIEDLAPVDEFHVGGRQASMEFLDQLSLKPDSVVLDIGCGLGGTARFTASRYRCRVSGIDLTAEYIETGRVLNDWVDLGQQIDLSEGSALETPYADAGFDCAYMMHVGMNIDDKAALAAEVYRLLKPGGLFGIYDIMRIGTDDLRFPLPWASTPAHSHVTSPDAYRQALETTGFEVTATRDRHAFALDFFARAKAEAAAAGPPALGLHVLMGESARAKFANLIANLSKGIVAPVEMIARKRG